MKKIIASAFSFLVMTSAHAHQYIQCWDMTPNSPDRLVLSLDNVKSTLFLSAEVNSDYPENSGVLELCKGKKLSNDIQEYWTRTEWAIVKVQLPINILNTSNSNFKVTMNGTDFNSDFSCYTAMYDQPLNRKPTTFCKDHEAEYLK